MRYLVTQDIKSPSKVGKGLYVQDFFFLIIYGGLSVVFSGLVNGSLLLPYGIFSGCMALGLTASSAKNRKRRNLQSMILYIRKSRSVYHPIQCPLKKEEGLEVVR